MRIITLLNFIAFAAGTNNATCADIKRSFQGGCCSLDFGELETTHTTCPTACNQEKRGAVWSYNFKAGVTEIAVTRDLLTPYFPVTTPALVFKADFHRDVNGVAFGLKLTEVFASAADFETHIATRDPKWGSEFSPSTSSFFSGMAGVEYNYGYNDPGISTYSTSAYGFYSQDLPSYAEFAQRAGMIAHNH